MKAVVYTRYGPPEVLELKELPKPVPRANEVLIKVHATTVTRGDCRMRSFSIPREQWLFARLYLGIFRPRRPILGMELAGEIESIGKNVTRFRPGDLVFASTFEANFGSYAEYKSLPETGVLAIKPANLSFGEAAASVGGGTTAFRCLRRGNLRQGQSILIYGASGAIGTNAVQLARNLYGAEVTGVCSTPNLEFVRSLGAARVVDYTREDFTRQGKVYDVVFDAVAKLTTAQARMAMKPGGTYLHAHRDANPTRDLPPREELLKFKEMLEAGTVKPVIDRVFPFEEVVAAHRYVDQWHKRGNVVLTVRQDAA